MGSVEEGIGRRKKRKEEEEEEEAISAPFLVPSGLSRERTDGWREGGRPYCDDVCERSYYSDMAPWCILETKKQELSVSISHKPCLPMCLDHSTYMTRGRSLYFFVLPSPPLCPQRRDLCWVAQVERRRKKGVSPSVRPSFLAFYARALWAAAEEGEEEDEEGRASIPPFSSRKQEVKPCGRTGRQKEKKPVVPTQ